MPVMSVPRISGATMTLMRRRKMSLKMRRCAANCGRSRPISRPTSMEKKIQKVRERLGIPAMARRTRASQRSQTENVLPGERINSAAPAANRRRPENIMGATKLLEVLGKGKGDPYATQNSALWETRHHSVGLVSNEG